MPLELWTPREIYEITRDDRFDGFPSHFLNTYFTESHYSAEQDILIRDLPANDRLMAPFVLPTEQGKPIWGLKGEAVRALRPAYVKPKDAVRAVEARNVRAQELFGQPLSLQQRFDMRVAEIVQYHVQKIRNTEGYLAAKAFIDGQVTIRYERDQGQPFPEVTITFGRDAGQTITLGSNYWDNPSTLIMDNIEAWANTMAAAKLGGYPTRMYVGSSVASVFKKNTQIKDHLDTNYLGGDVEMSRGITRGVGVHNPMSRIGRIGEIEVWAYRDQVEFPITGMVDILDPRDILLVAPGATGVRAYGAIYDKEAFDAGAGTTDIFQKMFDQDDPSATFILSQSAPLPIPLYPNRTLKARVLA